jgi:hypothetical protein
VTFWPEDLRGTFYFFTVWGMTVIELFIVFAFPGGFELLYYLTWIVLATATVLTAGFGVAGLLQARYDERKLRKQTEKYLYTQTTSYSEGDL